MKIPVVQIEHQIDIGRKTHETVRHDRKPADDQIPDVGRVQSPDDGFDTTSLHGAILGEAQLGSSTTAKDWPLSLRSNT
jgi:hypothetical protein